METKPSAAVDGRISKDGRHDSDAAAPHSTTTASLQGRAGSAFTPKLVELVFGPGSTRRAEKQSPRIACTAVAAPSVRSRVFVSACPSGSMARPGCRAPCSRRVTCWSIFLILSKMSSSFLSHRSKKLSILFSCLSSVFSQSRYISASVGSPDPNSSCWGMGQLPSGTASQSFRGMIGFLDTTVLIQPRQREGLRVPRKMI